MRDRADMTLDRNPDVLELIRLALAEHELLVQVTTRGDGQLGVVTFTTVWLELNIYETRIISNLNDPVQLALCDRIMERWDVNVGMVGVAIDIDRAQMDHDRIVAELDRCLVALITETP